MIDRLRRRVDLAAAAISGIVAGATYIATMEVDNRITGIDVDDVKLVGRPFVREPESAKIAGLPIHFVNSIAIALVYAAVARDRLPGPSWLRGATFAAIEGTVLYPLAALEDYHPGIRNGEIDRYWTLKAYLQSIPRHITYGAVLGSLYDRLRKA